MFFVYAILDLSLIMGLGIYGVSRDKAEQEERRVREARGIVILETK